jgi:aminoglycoside phosphotransferase (APT) family kinase protein
MDNLLDKPKGIRAGEELDQAVLEAFLKDSIPGLSGPISIKQFPSGHSNLTYLVTIGDREMVLRRPPFGTKAKTAHDMSREYKILKALQPVYRYAPEPWVYTEDETVMGCPFYVMDRVKGLILHRDLPPELKLSPEEVRQLFVRLVEVLHELHSVDYEKAGLANFGKPAGYVKRQVEGWSKRYRAARTPDAPDCEEVMAWLLDKMPGESDQPAIIHNDYKLDNVVLDADDPLQVVGVLDWEMATLGDPLMDLGGSLAYWVQPGDPDDLQIMRLQPTNLPGALTREEMVELYSRLTGRQIDNFDFYYCFGLFRLGVIAQQIYYRFYHGQTQDQRFKALVFGVTVLDKQARRVISGSSL